MKKPALVFVVEDDRLFQEILVHHLSHTFGFQVEAYCSGEECISNISKNPQIIILDYHLMNANGIEVLKRIKNSEQDNYILVVSSEEGNKVALESIRNGAYDYIQKDENTLDKITEKIELLQNLKEAMNIRKRRLSIMGLSPW